jgi:hypothetical protein
MNTKPQQQYYYPMKWETFPPEKLGRGGKVRASAGGQPGNTVAAAVQ